MNIKKRMWVLLVAALMVLTGCKQREVPDKPQFPAGSDVELTTPHQNEEESVLKPEPNLEPESSLPLDLADPWIFDNGTEIDMSPYMD